MLKKAYFYIHKMGLSSNIVLTGYHETRHNNDGLGNGPRKCNVLST